MLPGCSHRSNGLPPPARKVPQSPSPNPLRVELRPEPMYGEPYKSQRSPRLSVRSFVAFQSSLTNQEYSFWILLRNFRPSGSVVTSCHLPVATSFWLSIQYSI